MRRTMIWGLAFIGISLCQFAQGQSLLDRLEKKVQGAIGKAIDLAPGAAAPGTGYLGAMLDDTGENGRGVRVSSVKPNAPAAAAGGLKDNDLITAIDGKPINGLTPLDAILDKALPGQKLKFTVDRGGRAETAEVTLGNRPAPTEATPGAVPPAAPGPEIASANPLPSPTPVAPAETPPEIGGTTGGASLGITVVPLTDQKKVEAGFPVNRGALISAVRPGSAAELAELPVNGLIVRMNNRPIDSADALVAAIGAARPGQEVELQYYVGNKLVTKTVRLAASGGAAAGGGFAAPGGGFSAELPPPGPGASGFGGPSGLNPSRLGGLLPGGNAGGNRPLLQKIEQMASGLAKPTTTTVVYDPLAMAALQTRVVELVDQVKALEERVKMLEGKLGISAPAASPPGPAGPSFTPGFSAPPAAVTPGFGAPSNP